MDGLDLRLALNTARPSMDPRMAWVYGWPRAVRLQTCKFQNCTAPQRYLTHKFADVEITNANVLLLQFSYHIVSMTCQSSVGSDHFVPG